MTRLFIGSIAVFIGITGGFIREVESIPNNAQIAVFPTYGKWLPHHTSVAEYLTRGSETQLLERIQLAGDIHPDTYESVRKGIHKGFQLPEDFGSDEDFVIGYDQSLLWSWIFGKKKRWNEDGSWNY